VSGSGNGYVPGDILNNKYIIEVKETSKDSLTFNLSWIDKLWEESKQCIIKSKIPIFIIELGNGFRGVLVFITKKSQIDPTRTYISLSEKKSIKLSEKDFVEKSSFWYKSFMLHCISFEDWTFEEVPF
jgi:hypothetical protein